MTYPSGCQTPQTKEDWAEKFLRLLNAATPQQLQRFCRTQRARGGTFLHLVRMVEGEITPAEFSRLVPPLNEKYNVNPPRRSHGGRGGCIKKEKI